MALAMPPPISPTGLGNWVKNAQLIELKPCDDQVIKHQHQRRDDQDARTQTSSDLHEGVLEFAPVVVWYGHCSVLRFDARAGERFQQQLREHVDQHGHAEQHQADFKQRARINSPVASLNSIGDDAGQRVAGGEQ